MSWEAEGYYSDLLEPLLNVNLLGSQGSRVPFSALIDTGCNSTMIIFEAQREAANLPLTRRTRKVTMADGSQIWAIKTSGYLDWSDNSEFVDEILVFPDKPGGKTRCVIGMLLLLGKRLTLRSDGFSIEANC